MKVAVFSSKPYDRQFLNKYNLSEFIDFEFIESKLNTETASLVKGFDAVCAFVNDDINATVLNTMAHFGVQHLALRCAGFNNVDCQTANALGIAVSRVPAYSPEAVAEHCIALMLTLNRKMHKAYNRVKEGNFSLNGLLGFNMYGKNVGIIGTGKIGKACINILKGFGCHILCFDPKQDPELRHQQVEYVPLEALLTESDIISLHCPLTKNTQHIINAGSLRMMKDGVMLVNTSRGGLVDTNAAIQGLKDGKIGYLGLDVYEMESELFFEDLSCEIIQDDTFQRLLTFPNVMITGHQGFFTQQAMQQIAQTTIANILSFANNQQHQNPSFIQFETI